MSFIRCVLADFGIAYVPKVGVPYRYASSGPFDVGPLLVPKKIRNGYVLYDLVTRSGHVGELACQVGTFASMCLED
jgi:hypothetical protein